MMKIRYFGSLKLGLFVGTLLFSCASMAKTELSYSDIRNAYQNSYQYEKTQNYPDAIKAIGVIALHYPKAYTVNLRLGYLHYANGQYANALRHYKVAQEAIPNAISPLLGKMNVQIATQHFEDAEQMGYQIIKNDLFNYYGNLKLAYVLMQQGKLENALAIAEKMLAKYPEDVAFLTQYAEIMVGLEAFAQATETYSNILLLDPENVAAQYYFSMINQAKP